METVGHQILTLPSGVRAKTDQEYVDVWREFFRPLEEEFRGGVVAFDPDIVLETRGLRVELPLWFAKRLLELIAEVRGTRGTDEKEDEI